MACTEQPGEYQAGTAQQGSPAAELDVSENPTLGSGSPAAGDNSKPAPTPIAKSTPAPLNETQVLALVRGSCIYAGCHADVATVMASPNILVQVKDSLMPPPTQQRYTLRSADRAALAAYLED